MAAILKMLWDGYFTVVDEFSDPRVKDWTLMGSPFPSIFILIAYNYFVHTFGPKFMEKRKPYDLKNIMMLYNLSQILFNGYFVFESFRDVWLPRRVNLLCAEVDYSEDPLALKIASFAWMYFMTKILDLLDTVFMVLRKKQGQVSFLHVYHHSGMVVAGWIGVKYVPGGHGIFFATVNAFVHTVMYSYYFLTALYPEYKKSIWWKKHITELQLVQFVVTSLHATVGLLNPYCSYPKSLLAIFIPQDVFMFILFWDFYKKAYLKKPEKAKVEDSPSSDTTSHSKPQPHSKLTENPATVRKAA